MPELDLRTLIFVASLLGLFCTVVLFILRHSFPASIGGIAQWAWGCFATVISSALFASRGFIPELFSIALANTLLVAGFMAIYAGLLKFSGRRVYVLYFVVSLLLVAGLAAWFTLVHPSYHVRVMLISAINAALLFACTHLLWTTERHSLAGRFTGAALLLTAVVSGGRFVATATGIDPNADLLHATVFQKIYISSLTFSVLLLAVGVMMMANERLRASLEYIAAHDALSGAFSRGTFVDLLTKELARSKRHERPLAVLMLDLDNFKSINDRFGHLTGDRVIVDFVRTTESILRQHDFLGRYGGEEFIALLPETTLDEACVIAGRICDGVADVTSSELPAYTVSIGVAATHDGSMTIDKLLLNADAELYLAKENGRNRVEPAPSNLELDMTTGQWLPRSLRRESIVGTLEKNAELQVADTGKIQ